MVESMELTAPRVVVGVVIYTSMKNEKKGHPEGCP
jgi:hypothetical protein